MGTTIGEKGAVESRRAEAGLESSDRADVSPRAPASCSKSWGIDLVSGRRFMI